MRGCRNSFFSGPGSPCKPLFSLRKLEDANIDLVQVRGTFETT